MTAGMGHIGPASISNLAKDLRLELSGNGPIGLDKGVYTIEDVAERARTFFSNRYSAINPAPASPHVFEFWIGGYGANGARGEIWKFNIQDGTVHPIEQLARAEDDDRLVWGGQSKAIGRLIHSLDNEMIAALVQRNVSAADVNAARQQVETPLVHSTMPVQDAIDLADFLVDVTKRYFAFLPGANVVGGDTEIATVTKHEGFKWIKRKTLLPRTFEPKGYRSCHIAETRRRQHHQRSCPNSRIFRDTTFKRLIIVPVLLAAIERNKRRRKTASRTECNHPIWRITSSIAKARHLAERER